MPRVKAMTTGSIPSFLDVILNFAESDTTSSLAGQDSWLAQMRALNKGNLLMYGDDTWLKLFPGFFSRADGTTSFFVSDFTEVDNNVTRHLPAELFRTDWNTLVMHYLGLDHIGHKAGPRSPNMVPKQVEMDQIVRTIYTALESQAHLLRTLFVLCGDHGMNDAGNHGGSAPGETSPALVFMSPKLKEVSDGVECPIKAEGEFDFYSTVEQSDLVPTLAGLLGFPVPLNNLGVFIPRFLRFWEEDSDRLEILLRNSQQILKLVKATFPAVAFDRQSTSAECMKPSSDLDDLRCRWRKVVQIMDIRPQNSTSGAAEALLDLREFSELAQEIMSSTASNYNVFRLQAGMTIAALATCLAAMALVGVLSERLIGLSLLVMALNYGGMMFASSYVEEEQFFWYWAASSWVAYLCVKE
ncbi:MAG: major facilitator super transporter protein [Candelina submexicana]|nr:MAG: major facilitator super transporter protein [Candelina submexicana]